MPTDSQRPSALARLRRAASLTALTALLLVTPACDGLFWCWFFPAWCSGGAPGPGFQGTPSLTAVVSRLDTKTTPLALEDDGDPKDVKAKDRKTFKPSKGSEEGLDRRLILQSKQDDGEACLAVEMELAGAASAWVRVAVDDTSGLVDGQSLAFLERRHRNAAEGEPTVVRAEAVWNAKTSGFDVRSRVDGEVVGTPASIADETEIFLFLGPTQVTAYRADGPGHEDFGTASPLVSGLMAPSDTWTVAVGAEGLGKKGAFWFAELAFTMGASLLGSAEQSVGYPLGLAIANVVGADLLTGFPTGYPGSIASFLSSAWFQVLLAQSALDSAEQEGALADHVDYDTASKALAKARVKIQQAQKKADKLVSAGKPVGKGLIKPVAAALDACEVAMSTLHGFGSLSNKRLTDTIEFH